MEQAEDRYFTEHDLEVLPDDGRRHEIQGGILISEPVPRFLHADIQARLSMVLRIHADAHRLGRVIGEGGFVLARDPDTVLGPDVAFVAQERLAVVGDGDRFFPGPPDLAIEILSPSNRRAEIHAKVADYLSAGTRLVWIVDPKKRTVTTYRSVLAPRRLESKDTLDGEDILPGFSLSVGELFER